MSQNGNFVEDDSDIVTLEAASGNSERTGWVNVGVHAVCLKLTACGSLFIEVEPRGNEGTKVLGRLVVHKQDAVNAGGSDPDA
ncbi:hypothetical protein [Noviherbaspirillum pedocola]|uniref:Uncharacterized protein n=1 Tax=Noviherbaspirillum pedocola TaxID=2801341 RepID=A0A934SVT1_9BURK|nr:hypothetical protein [Noviherbaspirillum pedocola]MBK4736056.1 hypothetical protein [Noviherbaspirillum pedocola]